MKKYALIFVHVACASILLIVACTSPVKSKLKGNWHSKDGVTKLKITEKDFTVDDGESIAEDYVVKGDTIYTSLAGNQPNTNFVVQQVDDHNLKLMDADSVATEYSR